MVVSLREERERERGGHFLNVEGLFVGFRGVYLSRKKEPRPFAMRFVIAMRQLIFADRRSRAEEEEEVF